MVEAELWVVITIGFFIAGFAVWLGERSSRNYVQMYGKRHAIPKRPPRTTPPRRIKFDIEAFNRNLRKQPDVVAVVKVTQPGIHRYLNTNSYFYVSPINVEQSPPTDLYGLAVLTSEFRLYYNFAPEPAYETIFVDSIRWYGRPLKYHDYGENEILIHVERKEGWFSYHVFLSKPDMVEFVRALKQVTPETLATAYRRRRPYVHYGPVGVQPAKQDIYGAWLVDAPHTLYLTPLQLVLLKGQRVIRTIPLEDVQAIRAGQRLDVPEADGIVQFKYGEEKVAFTLVGFQSFADALAEAAKRSLEDPIQRKGKSKDSDEWK